MQHVYITGDNYATLSTVINHITVVEVTVQRTQSIGSSRSRQYGQQRHQSGRRAQLAEQVREKRFPKFVWI